MAKIEKQFRKILLFEPGTKLDKFPPLGLIELGSFMRQEGFEVLIEDYSGLDVDVKEVEKLIKEFDPFIVGVRVLTGPNILRGLEISKAAKKFGKLVVWGGPHPTILPEQTLQNENIDAVVVGEGEYAFLDLINFLSKKTRKKPFGCAIKDSKSKIMVMPCQKKVYDLDKAPLPAWDLLKDIDSYFPEKEHNVLPISTTRGCAYNCGFCHNSNSNVKKYLGCYRVAKPERAIEEYKFVQGLIKNKIDFLDVGEDLHLVTKDYARRFCDAVVKSGLGLKWATSARFHAMDLEICDLIADSGCEKVLFGVESGSPRIQKLINKPVQLEHARDVCKKLISRGVLITNAYIFGHPTETLDELKMTFKFLKEIPASQNLIQMYRPLPATPYFELCKASSRGGELIIPNNLEGWASFGVLGAEQNFSEIPDKLLWRYYFLINFKEQLKYLFNLERYYLRKGMFLEFVKGFYKNRFIFKAKELLIDRFSKH